MIVATPAVTPAGDVQAEVITDALRIRRREYEGLVLTDDPGLADGTLSIYENLDTQSGALDQVAQDFTTKSMTYQALAEVLSQENPSPDRFYILKVGRSASSPPTDYSDALTTLLIEEGLFFYHISAVTREPSERQEIATWAQAHQVIFHTGIYPGDRGTASVGTSLTVTSRHYGPTLNSVEIVDGGVDTTLSVSSTQKEDGGYKLTVNFDATGSDDEQALIDLVESDTDVAARFIVETSGDGSDALVAVAETDLAGSGTNAEAISDLATEVATQNSNRVKYYAGPQSHKYWWDFVAFGQSLPWSPGSFWLRWMPVKSVPAADDRDVFGTEAYDSNDKRDARAANINAVRTTRGGIPAWADDLTSAGNFGDIRQKQDRLGNDMELALEEALVNPPAEWRGGVPYIQEGIDYLVDVASGVCDRNAMRDRNIIAIDVDGTPLYRVHAPSFEEMAGTLDFQNRIYSFTIDATILAFIGEIRTRVHLTVEFIEPESRVTNLSPTGTTAGPIR